MKVVNKMKKQSKGFTHVELLVVIGILGILMGVLIPQITGSLFKANLSAMSFNGAKLVKAIIAESVSNANGEDFWAHRTEADGKSDDTDRINGMSFSTSTDYFTKLFDIDNQTSSDWQPFIDKELVSTLWGFGVPPAKPGSLKAANVGWTVVCGMPNDADGTIPVLVSRNVDTSNFAKSGTTNMGEQKTVPSLDKYPQPFGKKGCVIVYKSGNAKGLQSRDARLCDIYREQPNVTFAEGITLEYLVP